jgi:recombination protein RecA
VSPDIVNKSGAWYSYGDIKLGQGRENARQYLKDNPELAQEIKDKVLEEFNLGNIKGTSVTEDDDVSNE